MKKGVAILIVVLVCCGFIPQHKGLRTTAPKKSLSELYTEAVKSLSIHSDTLGAVDAIDEIIRQDSNFAPALHLLARISPDPKAAVRCAERAYLSDTTNLHYLQDYARTLINANEYNRALPVFKKLVKISNEPNNVRMLALLLHLLKQTEEAVAVLDSGYVKFGRLPMFSALRQNLLNSLGRILEAESDAKKALEEAPYLADNHIALAKIYMQTHRDSLALVSIQNAIAVDTLAVGPWLELGNYYLKKEDLTSYLSTTLRLFQNERLQLSDKLEVWEQLISDRGAYKQFLSLYDALIRQLRILYPNNRDVSLAYIRHLFSIGEGEEALRISKMLINVPSPKLEDLELVYTMEGILERPDSVELYLNRALEHYPNSVRLLTTQGAMAMNNNENDKAYACFNKALIHAEEEATQGEIYCNIGLLEYKRNNMKGCYKAYNRAIKCFDGDTVTQSNVFASLGDIEHERNNPKARDKHYNKALKYNADNDMVLNNYAYFLSLEERDLERALTMIERALVLSESSATYLDTKAWVLYKLGRYAEAKKVMQMALSLDKSNSHEYPLHYGDILHALGEDFMAKVYWRKALERGADKEEIEKRFLPEKK